MPALNEEKNISKALENVTKSYIRLGFSGEIIVINDGSTDNTELMVKGFIEKYPFIRMICHNKPKGIGASFWDGVRESRGELVTLLPGDAENDSYEILRYLPIMDHVDIVIPFFYNKEVRPWKRRMISKLYKGIINLSFGMLLNYMNGTVMYRKCVLQSLTLKNTGFFYQTELLIKAIKRGYLYAEVPYAIKHRVGGKSKALTLKSLLRVISGYFSTMVAVYILNKNDKFMASDSVTALRYRELNKNEQRNSC